MSDPGFNIPTEPLADIYANVRNRALEEAAEQCEWLGVHGKIDHLTSWMSNAAEAIRALKTEEK